MKIKKATLLLSILLIIFSITGCKENNIDIEPDEEENVQEIEEIDVSPAYGGEISLPVTHVKTLNPLLNSSKSLYYFNKLIYEGLFDFTEDMNIKNLLAESYTLAQDGKSININLRQNITWHDGVVFTANDVKFTIDAIKFGILNSPYSQMLTNVSNIQHVLDVIIHDDYNLTVIYDRSYSNGLESLTFPIIPRHQFEINGKVDKNSYQKALTAENYTPIGTGPYKFKEFIKLKEIKLESNNNWWSGKPYIERISGKILDDEELSVISFESGQLDLTQILGIDWERLAENEGIKIYEYVSQDYEFLAINHKLEKYTGEAGKALKKAIAYAIDRQTIIQKVYLGHATQSDVPIHPSSWFISDEATTYGYSVSKAKEILEAAGWSDSNNDGVYEDINGKNLSVRIITNASNDLRRKTADLIIENLKAVGIEAIAEYIVEKAENVTAEMADAEWEELKTKLYSGTFDIALLGWELSSVPDLAFAFHTTQIGAGTNFISYSNENIDALIEAAFSATSREEKREVYKSLQQQLVDELPYISLFFENTAMLTNKKIMGDINPQSNNIYNNIDKWYIPEVYQNPQENNNQ